VRKHQKKWNSLADNLSQQYTDLHVENFLSFIYTADIVSEYLESMFKRAGLTQTQVVILYFLLAQRYSMTPTEISNYTIRTKDTITKAINKLNKMGVTKSIRPRNNRRQRRVLLTDKGLELLEEQLPIKKSDFCSGYELLYSGR